MTTSKKAPIFISTPKESIAIRHNHLPPDVLFHHNLPPHLHALKVLPSTFPNNPVPLLLPAPRLPPPPPLCTEQTQPLANYRFYFLLSVPILPVQRCGLASRDGGQAEKLEVGEFRTRRIRGGGGGCEKEWGGKRSRSLYPIREDSDATRRILIGYATLNVI